MIEATNGHNCPGKPEIIASGWRDQLKLPNRAPETTTMGHEEHLLLILDGHEGYLMVGRANSPPSFWLYRRSFEKVAKKPQAEVQCWCPINRLVRRYSTRRRACSRYFADAFFTERMTAWCDNGTEPLMAVIRGSMVVVTMSSSMMTSSTTCPSRMTVVVLVVDVTDIVPLVGEAEGVDRGGVSEIDTGLYETVGTATALAIGAIGDSTDEATAEEDIAEDETAEDETAEESAEKRESDLPTIILVEPADFEKVAKRPQAEVQSRAELLSKHDHLVSTSSDAMDDLPPSSGLDPSDCCGLLIETLFATDGEETVC